MSRPLPRRCATGTRNRPGTCQSNPEEEEFIDESEALRAATPPVWR